ncbi:MAG: LpqB family beta-propeller domain-containing protein [Anaerolineae bacterium]|nr:LpqB family beta-propeller domain-containing protein [Anaerolineae bacterium]
MGFSSKRSILRVWLVLCAVIAALWLSNAAVLAPTAELFERAVAWLSGQAVLAQQTLPRGRIAFVSERNGNPEIYVMDANGDNLRRLTRNSAIDDSPAWSPNGRQIAFVSARDGNREIYTLNIETGALVRLTRNRARDDSPTWSPNGRQIAFVSDRDGVPQIYVMRADGSDVRRLTQTRTAESEPAWSPDGRRIAFVSARDGKPEIYVMNADGGSPRRLTNNSVADSAPRWSPDGRRLLFVSEGEGGSLQIFSMTAEGRDVTPLTAINAAKTRNFAPTWSPDGSWIAFTTDRDGYLEIYAIRVNGTGLRNLTRSRTNDYSPSWTAGTTSESSGGRPTVTPTPLGGGRQIGMQR